MKNVTDLKCKKIKWLKADVSVEVGLRVSETDSAQ